MTREEAEIRNAVDKTFPISNPEMGRTYEQALMATGFEAGIKWADNNTKSPWISVEDDLPCNHEDLLMPSKDYTKEVLACLIWMDHYEHKKIKICSMYVRHGLNGPVWYWNESLCYKVTHWMPLPETPNYL